MYAAYFVRIVHIERRYCDMLHITYVVRYCAQDAKTVYISSKICISQSSTQISSRKGTACELLYYMYVYISVYGIDTR